MLHFVDGFSNALNPLFAILLLATAIFSLQRQAPLWLGKVALATLVVQQIAQKMHKFHVLGDRFPSTHYAFALAIGAGFVALNRRFLWPVLLYLGLYALLILIRAYHTPLELLGALPAFPIVFFVARSRFGVREGGERGTEAEKIASG